MIIWWIITLIISITTLYIGMNLKQKEYTNILEDCMKILKDKGEDNRQLQEHITYISLLEDKNKKIKQENQGLINKNHSLKNQRNQLKTYNKKLKKENNNLKTENKALIKKGKENGYEAKINNYKNEIQKLNKALECKNNEIEILQNKKQNNHISEVLKEIQKEGIQK